MPVISKTICEDFLILNSTSSAVLPCTTLHYTFLLEHQPEITFRDWCGLQQTNGAPRTANTRKQRDPSHIQRER